MSEGLRGPQKGIQKGLAKAQQAGGQPDRASNPEQDAEVRALAALCLLLVCEQICPAEHSAASGLPAEGSVQEQVHKERSSAEAVWLHGTMAVEILEARGLPRHRVLLSCRKQTFAAANKCLGLSEKAICGVRPPQAYVTVNLGVATRCVEAVNCASTTVSRQEPCSWLLSQRTQAHALCLEMLTALR